MVDPLEIFFIMTSIAYRRICGDDDNWCLYVGQFEMISVPDTSSIHKPEHRINQKYKSTKHMNTAELGLGLGVC